MSKEFLLKIKDSTGTEKEASGDANGNLKVTLGTQLAGEDITNDVIKTEQRFTLSEISTAIGTLVKTGSGFIHLIQINNAGSAWEIDVYDGTSTSGTSIGKIRGTTLPTNIRFDGSFATGLYIDTVKGTTVGNLTVSYR